MKQYRRRKFETMVWLVSGLIFWGLAIQQIINGNWVISFLQVIIGLLYLLNAYLYRKPYLLLGEGMLMLNLGLRKKEILFTDITSASRRGRVVEIIYILREQSKKQNIDLKKLTESDREKFLGDLATKVKLIGR